MKEVLWVVEGANDISKMKSLGYHYAIKTNGYFVSRETISLIKLVAFKRPVIVLTDPDGPGKDIADRLKEAIPEILIEKRLKAREAKKGRRVGVAYLNSKTAAEILKAYPCKDEESSKQLKFEDMASLGLTGNGSKERRMKVVKHFHLQSASVKSVLNMLNCLDLTLDEIKEVLEHE